MSEDDSHPEFQFPIKIEGDESAVPAEYRPLYRKDPNDGSLQLISGLANKIESPGLKTALQKARADAREVERREKEKHRKTLEILGVESPDEVPMKLEELRRASAGATDAVRSEVAETFKRTYGAQLQQKEAEAAKLRKTLQSTLIDGEATRAIADAKGVTRALLPHVTGAMKLIEEDGELRPRVVDARGEVRYSNEGLPMTAADFVSEMRRDADFAGLFASSGSTGTGARGAGGSGNAGGGRGTKSYSRSEWRNVMARADKDPKDGGVVGGRAQLMRDYAAGKVTVSE